MHVKILSMGQTEQFNHLVKIISYLKPYSCVQIIYYIGILDK